MLDRIKKCLEILIFRKQPYANFVCCTDSCLGRNSGPWQHRAGSEPCCLDCNQIMQMIDDQERVDDHGGFYNPLAQRVESLPEIAPLTDDVFGPESHPFKGLGELVRRNMRHNNSFSSIPNQDQGVFLNPQTGKDGSMSELRSYQCSNCGKTLNTARDSPDCPECSTPMDPSSPPARMPSPAANKEYRPENTDEPISNEEVESFVNVDLRLLDNPDYFKAIFG